MTVSRQRLRSHIDSADGPYAWRSADAHYDQRVALISLYVWAAAVPMWSVALAQLAELLLLVVMIRLTLRSPREILSHPLFWITCFFVIYVFLRGWVASMESPDLFHEHWEGTRRWVKAGLLPALLFMAGIWASGAREKHITGLLLTLLVALTARLLYDADWTAYGAAIGGHGRYSFDLRLSWSSFLFGMAFIGTLICYPRIVRATRSTPVRCIAVCAAWSGLGLFFLTSLVASGTRAAWVATAAAIVAVTVTAALRFGRFNIRRRELVISVAVVALLTGIAAYTYGPRISARFAPTADAVSSGIDMVVGQGQLSDVPNRSWGIRIAYYAFGIQKFAERPLFGYGPANPIHLVSPEDGSAEDIPYQIRGKSSQFHSTPVDALLRFGLVGFLPIVALFALALYGIHKGWRGGRLAPSTGLLFVGFIVGFAIWCLAQVRLANYSTSGVVGLVTGIACSYLLPRRRGPSTSGTEADNETSA